MSCGNPLAISWRVYMKLTAEGKSGLAHLTRLDWWSTRRPVIGLHVRVRPPQVVRFNQTRADLMNGNRMKANETLYLISV